MLSFLEIDWFLKPYLLEAADKIIEIFGSDIGLELRLETDPELPDYRRLFGYVWTTGEVDETLDRLDRFDEAYYLLLPQRVLEKLNFSVRYR